MTVGSVSVADVVAVDRWAVELGTHLWPDGPMAEWVPAVDGHALVVGPVGSGKTVLMWNVVRQVRSAGWDAWVADWFGGGDPREVQADRVSDGAAAFRGLVEEAHALMQARYREASAGSRPVLLVVDDLSRLDADGVAKVQEILRQGRGARVHLLLLGLRAEASALADGHFDGFGVRIGLGEVPTQDSVLLFGRDVESWKARWAPGDGVCATTNGSLSGWFRACPPLVAASGIDAG